MLKKEFNYMTENRDFLIISKINIHFNDISYNLSFIQNKESFSKNANLRKAILFDFMQIGELFNQLSPLFIQKFNNPNISRLISIRNRIVHGYASIIDDIIYRTLTFDCPDFIKELNIFSRKLYLDEIKKFIGKKVKVTIDRPLGSIHNGITYNLNYGHIGELVSLDGEYQDAYILDEQRVMHSFEGYVIAIVHRLNDIEDKLIVSKELLEINKEQIEHQVDFQEKYFEHMILY